MNMNSITTIVSPDDGVVWGDDDDSKWNSLRPQDLEGELSQGISVRDGGSIMLVDNGEVADGSEARIAAATSTAKSTFTASAAAAAALSRHDLAEVCVQCALRLPTTSSSSSITSKIRVVRVTPCDEGQDDSTDELTERPNQDYFSRTGGEKAKKRAGIVTSVNWTNTLGCFVNNNIVGGVGDNNNEGATAKSDTDFAVKEFPKRPDVR